jgi:SAM-dependent methyltransferase
MRDMHLRNIDLNLLRAIQPLLEERHISRAAKRAFLSQPAMSRALNRLRAKFGDPLLVRSDGTYERIFPEQLAGKDAIELGCGTAYVSAWLSRREARVVGIDNSTVWRTPENFLSSIVGFQRHSIRE